MRKSDSRALLFDLLWKYRKRFALGLVALLFVNMIEIGAPLILKETIEVITEKEPAETLYVLAGLYFLLMAGQALGRYIWRIYLGGTSMMAGNDLRKKFGLHLFNMSPSFFDRRRIGDLMSLATNDTEAIRKALGPGLIVMFDALILVLSIPIAMFWLSPELTAVALIPLLVIPFIVIRNEREVHRRFLKVQESFARLSALGQENILGIRLVKAFAQEGPQIERFRLAGQEYLDRNLRLARLQTAFGPTLDLVMTLGLVILIFVGGAEVISGAITLGTFVALQRYLHKLSWPMMAVGLAVTFYQRARASGKRIQEVLDEKSDIVEKTETQLPLSAPEREQVQAIGVWKTDGRVRFSGLSFRYPGSENEVLSNISFEIEPGQRLALVGGIGAGKSALLSILPRIYPVADGKVFIDEVDLNDWPVDQLRAQIGYVSQDIFLFSQSVKENIALGLNRATSERVKAISEFAYVRKEIEKFSEGFDTLLGERGVNLSGGQRQRLALARALAPSPAILILDDAFSAVDVETEEKILARLRQRGDRNTELIAAHRISTVKEADLILVLENGKILQRGNHNSLLKEGGLYRKYYDQQRLREDVETYHRQEPSLSGGLR